VARTGRRTEKASSDGLWHRLKRQDKKFWLCVK